MSRLIAEFIEVSKPRDMGQINPISLKIDIRLDSRAVNATSKFKGEYNMITLKLVAPRLRDILR